MSRLVSIALGSSFALALALAGACGGGSSSAATSGSSSSSGSVVAWKPKNSRALPIARRTLDVLAHDPTGARPDWVLYDPKGDQVVFVGADAGNQRGLQIAQSYDTDTRPPPDLPRLPYDISGSAASALAGDPLAAPPVPPQAPPPVVGVTKVDDNHYTVERSAVDHWLADAATVARGARMVPSSKDGHPDGLKLYAIRPGSMFAAVGLQNGDTIHTINGFDLDSPDQMLEAYAKVRTAPSVDLLITRRGVDFALHYSIK